MNICRDDLKKDSPVLHVGHDLVPVSSEWKMVTPRSENLYSQNIRKMVSTEPSWFFNQQGLLCRKYTVYGSAQVVVPRWYRWVVLYNAHYQRLTGH